MNPERVNQLQASFIEHFQHVDAVSQVILKGHLLIEEQLDKIIGKFVFHPEYIEEASLRFPQKVNIARSMSLGDHQNEMWQLAIAINSLRNELAHSLQSENRQRKTKALIEIYAKLNKEHFELHKNEPEPTNLLWAVTLLMGFLGAFEEEVDRFRAYIDGLDHIVNPHRHVDGKT